MTTIVTFKDGTKIEVPNRKPDIDTDDKLLLFIEPDTCAVDAEQFDLDDVAKVCVVMSAGEALACGYSVSAARVHKPGP